MRRYGLTMDVLGMEDQLEAEEDDVEALIDDIGVLRKGARGDGVKIMQEALGIGADGVFGLVQNVHYMAIQATDLLQMELLHLQHWKKLLD